MVGWNLPRDFSLWLATSVNQINMSSISNLDFPDSTVYKNPRKTIRRHKRSTNLEHLLVSWHLTTLVVEIRSD